MATAPTTAGPQRPKWGYHTSLWQWRRPATWYFVVVMVAGILFTLLEQIALLTFSPAGWILSWVLLALFAAPVFIVVYALDLYEREPMSLVLGALGWGMFVAGALAGLANAGWIPVVAELVPAGPDQFSWVAAIVGPGTEEVLKGAGVILIYLIAREEMDDVMDGFVYGAMVGLGFAVIEHVSYFIQAGGGTIGGVLQVFFIRVIASGLYGHILYTGLFGMGVAYFVTRRGEATPGKRFLVAAGLILAGFIAHFVWNSPLLNLYPDGLDDAADYLQWFIAATIKGLPFLGFLILLVVLGRRREHRWLRYALQDEVGLQGLHHDELTTLENPRLRRAAVKRMAAQYGPLAAQTLKRLQKAHIDLAMIRTRTDDPNHPDLIRQRQYAEALRNWLVQATGHRGSTLAWNVPTAQPGSPPQQ